MTERDGQLALRAIRGVEVGYWDPLRRSSRWGRTVRASRPVHNFGDLLGPVIVRGLVAAFGLTRAVEPTTEPQRLLSVGSIAHFARPGDVLWGTGMNPKSLGAGIAGPLDARAVRGPVSRELLREAGIPSPEVYGDPALLLAAVLPRLVPRGRRELTIVPNLNESAAWRGRPHVINPRAPLRHVLRTIADSRLVVGSSLHGIIVAEALGLPARALRSEVEGAGKYADYFRATGRDPEAETAETVEEAVARGGAPAPHWDPEPLVRAFPCDLWGGAPSDADVQRVLARIGTRFSRSTAGTR